MFLGKGPSYFFLWGDLVMVIKSSWGSVLLWSPVSVLGGASGKLPVVHFKGMSLRVQCKGMPHSWAKRMVGVSCQKTRRTGGKRVRLWIAPAAQLSVLGLCNSLMDGGGN